MKSAQYVLVAGLIAAPALGLGGCSNGGGAPAVLTPDATSPSNDAGGDAAAIFDTGLAEAPIAEAGKIPVLSCEAPYIPCCTQEAILDAAKESYCPSQAMALCDCFCQLPDPTPGPDGGPVCSPSSAPPSVASCIGTPCCFTEPNTEGVAAACECLSNCNESCAVLFAAIKDGGLPDGDPVVPHCP